MRYGSLYTIVQATLFSLILFSSIGVAGAQVMQSGSYQMQSDSINMGGGLATSSSYQLESTVGEVATGISESGSYELRAGYQQMQEVYIALSGATTTILLPYIGGVTGGVSNGSTTLTVITDSPSGYALTIQSEATPAMQSGANTIFDYVPSTADPDFNFLTTATNAHFGYSPEGNDVADRFLDNGASCNVGSLNTALHCWDGLSTSSEVIAQSANANHPNGATTTIHFRVGVGSNVNQAPGEYVATTTVTAIPL